VNWALARLSRHAARPQRRVVALRQGVEIGPQIRRHAASFANRALDLALLNVDVLVDAIGAHPSGRHVAGIGDESGGKERLGGRGIRAGPQCLLDLADAVPGGVQPMVGGAANGIQQGLGAALGGARSDPQGLIGKGGS
jgi:hypothetical protein